MQILFKSNDKNPQAHISLSRPAVLAPFFPPWRRKLLFSTNFCLPILQNPAYTMVSLKGPLKADSQSWKETQFNPQPSLRTFLRMLTSLYLIPSQDEEATFFGTRYFFWTSLTIEEVQGFLLTLMWLIYIFNFYCWQQFCLVAAERISQACLTHDNPSFIWRQLLCPP